MVVAGALAATASPATAAPSFSASYDTYELLALTPEGTEMLGVTVQASALPLVDGLGVTVLAIQTGPSGLTDSPSGGVALKAGSNIYQCYGGGTVPVQSNNPMNPKKCSGSYYILDSNYQVKWSNNAVKSTSPLWTAVANGYTATQKWCSNNSFTCNVVTAIGVTLAFAALSA